MVFVALLLRHFDGLVSLSNHSDRRFVCGILFLSPRLFFGCQDCISVDVLTLVVTELVEVTVTE